MILKNLISKLYLSLGLIAGITIIMATFTSYSDNVLEQNNKQINIIDEKMIFFENILAKHESYVKDILNSIVFQTQFTKELDPYKCSLGRWYYKTIDSVYFKNLPRDIQDAILNIEDDHKILHRVGRIIKEKYVDIDRGLKTQLMKIKIAHLKFRFYIKDRLDNKEIIQNGLNSQTCKFGTWWDSYKLSYKYKYLTTPEIKVLLDETLIIHEGIHKYVIKIKEFQSKNEYTKAYIIFNNEYKEQVKKFEQSFNNIIEKINVIDTSNDHLQSELIDLVPVALRNMKSGLEPYQDFLTDQKNETIKKTEKNSEIIDTISIFLTIVNILILIVIGYWSKYKLVEKIKYLKARYKELQDTQGQLIQSEKMASLGGMVAGVAHEINTPIGMALTAITNLEDETKDLKKRYDKEEMTEEDFDDFLVHSIKLNKSININLNKAATLVRSFKQVAVDQTSDHDRKFEFHEYVDEILQSLNSKIKKTKLKVELNIDKNISIYSNPGAFSQIISNFIVNSIIHGFDKDQEGIIKIEAIKNNNDFILKYSDNGKGLDEETKEKVFEPFYTTNRANGGSGLGMNIVFNLVTQKLHGTIDVQSEVNKGILFTIKAPLHYKS